MTTRPPATRGVRMRMHARGFTLFEVLIAVTNEPKLTVEDLRGVIKAKGMSTLAVPREIKAVREIPKLGTGKVNHRELAKMI